MRINDILNEQDSEGNKPSPKFWKKFEIATIKTLIKKDFDKTNPSDIKEYLTDLGFEKEEIIDLYYLFKNNVVNGEFDINKEPNRERNWEDFDPKQIALAIHLDLEPFEIEEKAYGHMGLTEYETPEGDYAVGNDDEADRAAEEGAKSDYEDGIFNPNFVERYLYMTDTDRRLYAQDNSDNYVDDLRESDIIDEANISDEIDEIDIEISELQGSLDSEIEDPSEYEEKWDEIQKQIDSLEKNRESLIEESKEKIRESKYDETYEELGDPIEYFINTHGFFRDINQLIEDGPVRVDEHELIKAAINSDGRGHFISPYDGIENYEKYDGEYYYIYRIN